MASQSGWLDHNTDTLHNTGEPQRVSAKEHGCSQSAVSRPFNRKPSGRKMWNGGPATGATAALKRTGKKNLFNNLSEHQKKSGLRLEPAHLSSPMRRLIPHLGYDIRSSLPGLRRKRPRLLLSGPKSSLHFIWK